MAKGKIKIENIVASTTIAKELDLMSIASTWEDVEYEPEQFPGLVYRLKEPRTATLLFGSGKANCTGARTVEGVHKTIETLVKRLKEAGIPVIEHPEIVVQNIVATYDLGKELDLNAIAVGLGLENIEYEPEQFPGLVYRLTDLGVVVLLFGSGKIVCTGARHEKDVELAVEKITERLTEAGFL